MDLELVKKKKKKGKSTVIGILLVLILTISISYGLFKYSKTSDNEQLIAGDIYMKAIGNEVTSGNIRPMDKEEGKTKGNKYKFKVEGYNNSKKDIYYGIYLKYGEEQAGKERFKDEDIMVYLTETKDGVTKDVFGPGRLADFNSNLIYANTIDGNIEKQDKVDIDYELTVWLSDNILISDTETSFEGKTIYTSEEFENSYFSLDVEVEGDFVEKNIVVDTPEIDAVEIESNKEYDIENHPQSEEDIKVILKTTKEVIKAVVTNVTENQKQELTPTKVGNYYQVEIIADKTAKYNYYFIYKDSKISDTYSFNININPERYTLIEKPTEAICIAREYNGKNQDLVENNKEGYILENYQQKDAGNYQVKAKLQDKYRWSDKSEEDITVNCSISKKDLIVTPDSNQSKVYGSEEKDLTYTYKGNLEEPGFTGKLGRAEGDEVGTYLINKGTLDIEDKAPFKASNYNLKFSETPVNFEITKATPKLTLSSETGEVLEGKSVTITGTVTPSIEGSYTVTTSQEGIVTTKVSGNEITITGVSNGSVDVVVTFNPTDNKNYNKSNSVTYKVTGYKVASEGSCSNPTYNGASQALASGGTGITLESNSGEEAKDNYTVTEKLQNGYRWSDNSTSNKTLTCKINKKNATIKANDQTVTYGTAITNSVSQATAEDLVSNHTLSEVTISTTATNVPGGKITASNAKITASGTDVTSNYNLIYVEGNLTITKANIGTGSCKENLVYSGVSQELVDKIKEVTYTTDTTGIDAKTYPITVKPDSNHKFEGGEESKTLNCKISPKGLNITWENPGTYTYTGGAQGPSGTVSSGVENETVKLTITKPKNAGTKLKSTAVIESVEGGRANKGNYSLNNPSSAEFTINKATPTLTLSTIKGVTSIRKTTKFKISTTVPGSFIVSSISENTASASFNDSIVTVRGQSLGSTNIKVEFYPTDESNYNSVTNKDYLIVVSAPTLATSKLKLVSEIQKVDEDGNIPAQSSSIREYRYTGVSPNNYLILNNDGYDELWRIIGIFKEGNEEFIKIVSSNPISANIVPVNYSYAGNDYTLKADSSNKGDDVIIFDSTKNNLWPKAGLQYYLNTENDNNGNRGYLSYLSNEIKDIIRPTDYYYGDIYYTWNMHSTFDNVSSSNDFYLAERDYDRVWNGLIGLVYPSDVVYSFYGGYSISSWISESTNSYSSYSISWGLNPMGDISVFSFLMGSALLDQPQFEGYAYPTMYLKSSVNILTGDGTKNNPYFLSYSVSSSPNNQEGPEIFDDNIGSNSGTNKTASLGSCNKLEYNGESQILASGGKNVTYSNNTGIEAGTYTVTATTKNGYFFNDGSTSKTLSCTIEKKAVTVNYSSTSVKYTGGLVAPKAIAIGVKGEEIELETTKASEVGEYTTIATMKDVNPNYTLKNTVIDYEITKDNVKEEDFDIKTKVVINYYLMNKDKNGYTLVNSKEINSKIDDNITGEVLNYEGYKSPKEITIKVVKGINTINYYYDRKS